MQSTPSDALSGPLAARDGLFQPTAPPDRENGAERVWYYGVDPSTVRVSFAAVADDGRFHVRTHSFTRLPPRTGRRLKAIYTETDRFVRELAVEFPPARVLVEQPFAYGRQVEPELYYAVGLIVAACEIAGPASTVPVGTWKKEAVGYGAAKKPDVMRWAKRQGYAGTLQDEGDALGIAFACRALHAPKPEQLPLTA